MDEEDEALALLLQRHLEESFVVAPSSKPAKKAASEVDGEQQPAQTAAFRLFSFRGLQEVNIEDTKDEGLVYLPPPNPRIYDVADEPKRVRKQRRKDIESVAVDGAAVLQNSSLVSTMRPQRPALSRHFDSPKANPLALAFLVASIPASSLASAKRGRIDPTAKKPKKQLPRRPLERRVWPMTVRPVIKEDKGLRKHVVPKGKELACKSVIPVVQNEEKIRKTRLSKARRAKMRSQVGQ